MDHLTEGKIFNDPIHGNILIHPLCVKIIDTLEFQRLRNIKQLGAVQFVYPGATHTRFEHSIGTCYLAGEWLRHLRDTLPPDSDIIVTREDELCVMIAGLCHDLGHGPFSHMFDKFYMQQVKASKDIPHEELSVKMLEHLINKNNLRPAMEHYAIRDEQIKLISDMINPQNKYGEEYQRMKKRMFLYEIVNNKENGIDVDKWDYFARDCLHVNITNSFDYRRLVKFSRVLAAEDGRTHICFRDKEAENLYKMFELRYDLHRQVYSHKVTHTLHIMLADALFRANGHLDLLPPGDARNSGTAASLVDDMRAFALLTDVTIWQIQYSHKHELGASRQIISDILSRKFYPCFRTCPSDRKPDNEVNIKTDICDRASQIIGSEDRKAILVYVIKLDYSKGKDDPIDDVNFYEKKDQHIIKLPEHKKLRLPPKQFCQHVVSVCWRNYRHSEEPNKVVSLREAFRGWCKAAGYIPHE